MFCSAEEILSTFKISYLLCRTMGMANFSLEDVERKQPKEPSKLYTFKYFVIVLIATTFSLFNNNYFKDGMSELGKTWAKLLIFLISGEVVFCFVWSLLNRDDFIKLYHQIFELQKALSKNQILVNFNVIKLTTGSVLLVLMCLFITYCFRICYTAGVNILTSTSQFVYFLYCLSFYPAAISIYITVLVSLIEIQKAQQGFLNSHFNRIKHFYNFVENLDTMLKIVKLFNRVMKMHLIISFTQCFTLILFQVYSFIDNIYIFSKTDTLINGSIILLIIIPVHLYFFFLAGTFYKNNKMMKRQVLQLLSKTQMTNIKREIRGFYIESLHKDYKITVGDLFEIDYPLIISIIGAVTTNLVIFVQDSPGSN